MAKLLSTQRHCSYRTSDCRRKPDRGCFVFGSRPEDRRGVLLLVCLVLLVMFLMLGVTFVLTAGSFRRSSEAYQRMMERPSADLPERSGDLLDSVARDLVRGTTNPDSPFSKENLLEDLYGQTALRGRIAAGGTANSNAQVTAIAIAPDSDFTLSGIKDYYSGLVMTFLTGDAAGHSARIVSSSGDSLSIVTLPGGVTPSTNDIVLVNGRPFSGDGSGQDDGSGSNATVEPRRLNEDYDAPDINNPWLASKRSGLNPSWDNNFKWGSNTDGRIRPYGKTPMVDNDGDGEKDSIWIDAGLPLQIQPDGSYVRPLVAMLVRDMDGRVNLNAHGSAKQLDDLENASSPLGQGYGPGEIDPWQVFHIREGVDFDMGQFLSLRLNDNLPADGYTGSLEAEQPSPPEASDDQQDFSEYYQIGTQAAVVTPLDPHGNSLYQANATGTIDFQTADGGLANDFDGTTYAMEIDTSSGITPDWHAPYVPEDLERVLRFSDADADALDSRLYEDLAACYGNSEIDPDDMKEIRERITTESWDLPVAGLGLPEELYEKIDEKIDGLSLPEEEASQLREYLFGTGHITDLAKAKWYLANPDNPDGSGGKVQSLTDLPSLKTALEQLLLTLPQGGFGPGLTRGTRFNVNRLFGNGQDDNGNAVVDDVGEVGTETITAPGYSGITFNHDGSGAAGEPNDKFARQHYAQQIYLLLMLLADSVENQVPDAAGASPDESRRMLARRLAQFAINAADYRDPDAIMTPFEYDANPFDADGWTTEAEGDLNTTPTDKTEYGVVWGCEAPVAALGGTLALHDLRLRDTQSAGGKTTDFKQTASGDTIFPTSPDSLDPATDLPLVVEDEHFDQYAPPEGSLFLQVVAVPQSGTIRRPRELFTSSGSDGQLDLSKTTAGGDPVWRVAVSQPHPIGQSGQMSSGSGSPVLNQMLDQDGSGGELSDAEQQGSLWNPRTTLLPNRNDPASIQFAVDGVTSGKVDDSIPLDRVVYFSNAVGNAPQLNQVYLSQTASVQLAPGNAMVFGPRQKTKIRQSGIPESTLSCDVVCASTGSPANWAGSAPGMSISEPYTSNYYQEIDDSGASLTRGPDPSDPEGEIYVNVDDVPFDNGANRPINDLLTSYPLLLESNRTSALTQAGGNEDGGGGAAGGINLDFPQVGGTIQNHSTAFLQRLADPTQNYDAITNPYITVDLMPIDLTVYNGEDSQNAAVFASSRNSLSTGTTYANTEQLFDRGWRSRVRFNAPAGSLTGSTENPGFPSSFVSTTSPAPFWPNRPLVSQYEFLMVPASEPGKLAFELGSHQGNPGTQFTGGFPHLLNFFYEASASSPGPRLGRIFEYLHVPSKFAGTQLSLSPTSMSGVDGFAPPFNVISTYREPGRVNLNTVEAQSVWDAVMNGTATDVSRHHGTTQLPATTQVDPFHGSGAVEQAGSPLTAAPTPLLDEKLGFEDTSASNDAFLRYQPINRMGNLVTNRSNVYAVWMTLGFFETDPNGDFKTDQDGNLIEDGNEVERHRAFYLIDRSIPVGYENGHDHNTDDVFRVMRYIE